jgi:hypothetical protein
MAISSTSPSLGSAQALATQVDALAASIAAINAGTAGSPPKGSALHNALIAQQALAQTDLVNALLASGRLAPASVVTSLSVPLTADQSTRVTTYTTQSTAGMQQQGQADKVRREAVQNAMNTGTVSANSILSTMT